MTAPARQFGPLLVSRVFEQGSLAAVMLVVARAVSVDVFAWLSSLFVINSIAIALSDYGMGLAILAAGRARLDVRSLRRVRRGNVAIAFAGTGIGVVMGGMVGAVIAAAALLWGLSAEGYIRKSAAIRAGETTRAAIGEGVATVAFLTIAALALYGEPIVAVIGGLLAKHCCEIWIVGTARDAFTTGGTESKSLDVWLTQGLAYAVANVDFLVVAVAFGARAYGTYVLAFRFASSLPSLVASVATRVSTATLAAQTSPTTRSGAFRELNSRLFKVGTAGILPTWAVALALPVALGSSWDDVRPTMILLALALPWRLVLGLGGSLALAAGEARPLLQAEAVRVGATVIALVAAVPLGYGAVVATAVILTVISVPLLHGYIGRRAGASPWRPLTTLALPWAATALALAKVTDLPS